MTVNHSTTFFVSATDGSVESLTGQAQGLYADDTRFLSRHRLRLNGRPLRVVAAARLAPDQARWTLMASEIGSVESASSNVRVTVTVDRLVTDHRLHEDVTIHSYGGAAVLLLLEVVVASDFADLFEVRTGRWQRRDTVATTWHDARLETAYSRDGFVRRCVVRAAGPSIATYANGELHFPLDLDSGQEWRACLQYDLLSTAGDLPPIDRCPFAEDGPRRQPSAARWRARVSRVSGADRRLVDAHAQATDDLGALRIGDLAAGDDIALPAAGIPWFVAVFGRDSSIVSLQTLSLHPPLALGTLEALQSLQSDVDDPVRDAQPGKICHELRVGEWARFHTIPHSPYYGTADATPLYLLLLAEAHRWLGDAGALRRFRPTAERCLEWIDHHGDCDGDGFQEYAPRAPGGYRNHCWRDAEDGVLDEQGGFPPHPIGTCELQAYVIGAKRSMADLFAAWGDHERAAALHIESEHLRRRFVDAYWMDDEGTVAFALDGAKRPVRTATSNPGHVLWMGVLNEKRGNRVVDRLMRPDLFTGWGLRTLSSDHVAFDPHAYQRGSVWPHDTMLAAAGMLRYGRTEEAWRLIDGLMDAVQSFNGLQMPELFAGLGRVDAGPPVVYEQANVPQAWSAGCVIHAARLLLGLEPDAPSGRVYLDPVLPSWCPELSLANVRIGDQRVTVHAARRPDGSCDVQMEGSDSRLTMLRGRPPWLALPTD